MPEETHNWLINFQGRDVSATTSIDALMAKLEQLRTSVAQTNATLGQLGTTTGPVTTAQSSPPVTAAGAAAGGIPPSAFEGTATTARAAATAQTELGDAISKMGGSAEFTSRVTERLNELVAIGIPLKQAQSRAVSETTHAMLEEAGAIEKSGHWLGGYIQRYLIRYFVVWQGMVALKTGIRDWAQAHDDAERAIFRLQTTMGMTTDQAERYMATMKGMGGGFGLTGAQLATGAMGGLGATGAGMAGQFGAMTGIGAGAGMDFFAGIQRQYDLSAKQIEELIPRMFAAFARSGQPIQAFMKDWETMLAKFDAGSSAVSEWTRALKIYETTGMRATDNVSRAWSEFLTVLGNTQPITDAKNAIADWFTALTAKMAYTELSPAEKEAAAKRYEAETGKPAAGTTEFWKWGAGGGFEGMAGLAGMNWRELREKYLETFSREEQAAMERQWGERFGVEWQGLGESPLLQNRRFTEWALEQGIRAKAAATGGTATTAEAGVAGEPLTTFVASGFERMTQAQFEQYDKLREAAEGQMKAANLTAGELTKQIITNEEGNLILRQIETNTLADAIASEEMNERQKTAVYNWPGNVSYIAMGAQAATGKDVGVQGQQTQVNRPTWQPQNIDWGSNPNYWYYIPGISPWSQYQYGTKEVRETGPAIVHKGEQIIPAGGGGMAGNLTVQSNLYLNHRVVALSVSRIQGDQLLQAQRAAGGQIGSIASM